MICSNLEWHAGEQTSRHQLNRGLVSPASVTVTAHRGLGGPRPRAGHCRGRSRSGCRCPGPAMHWPLAAASSTGRAGNTWAAAVDPPRPVALGRGLRGGTVAQADRNPFYLQVEVDQQNVNGDRHGATETESRVMPASDSEAQLP
jgi:hypothetical protein